MSSRTRAAGAARPSPRTARCAAGHTSSRSSSRATTYGSTWSRSTKRVGSTKALFAANKTAALGGSSHRPGETAPCSRSPSCLPSASPGIPRELPRRPVRVSSSASESPAAWRPLARAPTLDRATGLAASSRLAPCGIPAPDRRSPASAEASPRGVYAAPRAPLTIESPYVMGRRGLVQRLLSAMRGARRIKA